MLSLFMLNRAIVCITEVAEQSYIKQGKQTKPSALLKMTLARSECLENFQGNVFKYLLRNCTICKDACERTYLIVTFIRHLIHFRLGFLEAFFKWGIKKYHLQSLHLIETGYSHKMLHRHRPLKILSNITRDSLLTSAVLIKRKTKFSMIMFNFLRR